MLRVASAAFVLLLSFAAAGGAPAPMPRSKGGTGQARLHSLKRELRERGVSVTDVSRADADAWVVRFTTTRAACPVGLEGKVFSSRIEARDREEALKKMLRRCREEDEATTRRLRAFRLIP